MIDPNTAMSAAGEGAKALSKFEEIIQKVFGPSWTKKQADADTYADERKLQIIRENPDMDIVYINGQMNARARIAEGLAFRAEQRRFIEDVRQEKNLEKILENAKKELLLIDKISDDSVDDDWLTRFFGIAKDVSSNDMQFIWSKILAGEVARPSSFSLRTLETIRNISCDEAKIFEKILPYVARFSGAHFIPAELLSFMDYNIGYGDIIQLDDCGLINSGGETTFKLCANANCVDQYLLNTKNELLTITNPMSTEMSVDLRVYPLTRSAIELLSILNYSSDRDYTIRLSKKIHDNYFALSDMYLYQIDHIEDGNVYADSSTPICTINRNSIQ